MTFSQTVLGLGITIAAAVFPAALSAQSAPQAITITVPSERVISYSLAAGGVTGCIALPGNVPISVMGVQLTAGFRGIGQVSLLSIPGSFVEWVGLESTAGAAITQGFSGATGTHIVFIDFSHQVDIEVCAPSSIRVHNTSTGVRTGRVSLIW